MTGAPALARRFYNQTAVTEMPEGYGVALDQRTLRTPGGAVFVAPTRTLAQLCADEWDAQGEHIVPATMPVSQLAFAALDQTARRREELAKYVASFGETDLCCHRAGAPAELVKRQANIWDPMVAWGKETLDVALPVVTGVIAAPVDAGVLAKLRVHAAALDAFCLAALAQTAGLAGSTLIAFALIRGRLTPAQAFEAAALDNLWSLERWGEDAEARDRLTRQQAEFEAIGRFIRGLDT